MNRFSKWLIRKLGGVVVEDLCDYKSDYWEREHLSKTLYVSSEHYTDAAMDDIERELAENIGKEMLRRDLLCFSVNHIHDHGDVPIHCYANVLKIKNSAPYHMKPHLRNKGD